MIKRLFDYIYEYNRKKSIRTEKQIHLMKVHSVELQQHLKKYRPRLEKIASDFNHFIYDVDGGIMNSERHFIFLFVLKTRDLFESTLLIIGVRNYHSIFPLMRSLIESLYLLKYIQKNPQYLNEFIETQEIRGERVGKIIKAVNDKGLYDLYSTFSDTVHINPGGFKITQYAVIHKMTKEEATLITQNPRDEDQRYDTFTLTLINLMEQSVKILYELESKT